MRDFNYEIYNKLVNDIVEYLLTNEDIKSKTIGFLLSMKENLNEDIDNIIYLDNIGEDLTEKDLKDINYKRETIDTIYHIIEKLGGVR